MSQTLDQLRTATAGRYEIERELGAGGMATVYLAVDLRHDRRVAIKVLRPELAAILGGERFLKEIRLTANLQHPHILPLHDSGETDGLVYYVMPYVEGESLRERLLREKQLPVDDAVRIGREVAGALDYAHRHGVVHRDIKPENILLHDGQALVADFGIALAVSSAGGSRMTETGMSLGTPHYMSPEQAMGAREITPRSDVYALGCVLYEMLIGEPPFTGPTAQAIVARVVTEEPRSLTLQRRTIAPQLEVAVLKALAKLPADRYGTAAQFAEALSSPGSATESAGRASSLPPHSVAAARRAFRLPVAAAVAVAALILGAVAGRLTSTFSQSRVPPARFSIPIPTDHSLSGGPTTQIAISPDGTTLAYVGENAAGLQLYIRRLDDFSGVPVPGTEGAGSPQFSPDGRWIAFLTGSQLKKTLVTGGAPITIPTPPGGVQAVLWTGSDELLVTSGDGSLHRLKGDGTFDQIARPQADEREAALIPWAVLPDGSLLAIASSQGSAGPLIAIDPRNGKRDVVSRTFATGVGYDGGYLAWAQQDGTLFAAPFDARRHRVTGSILTLAPSVRVAVGGPAQLSVSRNGSLVYVPALPFDLVEADRSGRAEPIAQIQRRFHSPRVAPDGRRVAVDFIEQGARDVWLLDLNEHTLSRLSFEQDGHDPTWTPDGRRLLYATARNGAIGVFLRQADGSGTAESVLVQGTQQLSAHAVTPDGREALAVNLTGNGGSFDLVAIPLSGERQAKPLLATPFNEGYPAISPNGRWLAYVSDESGKPEVYVRPFPGPGGKVLISQSGGTEPVWGRSGRELFYRGFGAKDPEMMVAVVETGSEFRVVSRTALFSLADYESATPHANFDVTPDGQHFILVHQGRLAEIALVQNWPELVRRQSESTRR